SREYLIKGSLVFNFLQYVEWPPDSLQRAAGFLRLCFTGQDRFGVVVDSRDGELVQGRHVKVRHLQKPTADELTACDVVFVSADTEPEAVVSSVERQPILTIGETSDF